MTQEEVDVVFNITILIHESKWFGERKDKRDRDEVHCWNIYNALWNVMGRTYNKKKL